VDEDVKENLKFYLIRYHKGIVKQYASYTRCICLAIKEKGLSVSDLKDYLMSLDVFEPEKCEHFSELEKAETIDRIFEIVKKYASYLNYEIYQCIVDEFGIDNGQDALKYPEHLKAYIEKHTISELAQIMPIQLCQSTDPSKKFTLKLDIEVTSKSAKVINLKVEVARILEVGDQCCLLSL